MGWWDDVVEDSGLGRDGYFTNFVEDTVPFGGWITAPIQAAAGHPDYALAAADKGLGTGVNFAVNAGMAAATAGTGGVAGAVLFGALGGAVGTMAQDITESLVMNAFEQSSDLNDLTKSTAFDGIYDIGKIHSSSDAWKFAGHVALDGALGAVTGAIGGGVGYKAAGVGEAQAGLAEATTELKDATAAAEEAAAEDAAMQHNPLAAFADGADPSPSAANGLNEAAGPGLNEAAVETPQPQAPRNSLAGAEDARDGAPLPDYPPGVWDVGSEASLPGESALNDEFSEVDRAEQSALDAKTVLDHRELRAFGWDQAVNTGLGIPQNIADDKLNEARGLNTAGGDVEYIHDDRVPLRVGEDPSPHPTTASELDNAVGPGFVPAAMTSSAPEASTPFDTHVAAADSVESQAASLFDNVLPTGSTDTAAPVDPTSATAVLDFTGGTDAADPTGLPSDPYSATGVNPDDQDA
jgi:hypothetical protein